MKKIDTTEILPLFILMALAIYSIYTISNSNYSLNSKQYIGITLTCVSFALFFINKKAYQIIFGITLISGVFNLTGVTVSIVTFNILWLPIQIIYLPILLLFVWINNEDVGKVISWLSGTTEEDILDSNIQKVNGFKRRFKNLSDDEIEKRLNQPLTNEAKTALKEIKEERKKNESRNTI